MGRNSPSTRPKLHPEITHRIPKFTSEALKSMDELEIIFEAALTRDENSDSELYVELRFFRDFNPKDINMGPVEILKILKRHDCFPYATIAYRVMLTIHVTLASAERNFSKFNLLKSYLHFTMT